MTPRPPPEVQKPFRFDPSPPSGGFAPAQAGWRRLAGSGFSRRASAGWSRIPKYCLALLFGSSGRLFCVLCVGLQAHESNSQKGPPMDAPYGGPGGMSHEVPVPPKDFGMGGRLNLAYTYLWDGGDCSNGPSSPSLLRLVISTCMRERALFTRTHIKQTLRKQTLFLVNKCWLNRSRFANHSFQ